METSNRFYVKYSTLYCAYCIYDSETQKVLANTDNVYSEYAQHECDKINLEYFKIGQVLEYGI